MGSIWNESQIGGYVSRVPGNVPGALPAAGQVYGRFPARSALPAQPAAISPGNPAVNPIGRRIAAAFIDFALLTAVFVSMSLVLGQTSQRIGHFGLSLSLFSVIRNGQQVGGVSLGGVWAVLYLLMMPLYYFAMEAAVGQTVGKWLLGLRVLRADGERASAGAIAGRTLLRLVDGFPVLYLVGFITMLATGRRHQRLGDLAAGTVVARVQPARHRGLALIPMALLPVALVALVATGLSAGRAPVTAGRAAVGADGAHTYRGHGVSFSYPAGWQSESASSSDGGGTRLWQTAFDSATGTGLVWIGAYEMDSAVVAGNLGLAAPQVTRQVRSRAEHGGGTVQAGPRQIKVDGLPSLRSRVTGLSDGTPVETTLVVIFDGTTEYTVACSYFHSGAAEAQAACGQVLSTFRAPRPQASTGATGATGASGPMAPLRVAEASCQVRRLPVACRVDSAAVRSSGR